MKKYNNRFKYEIQKDELLDLSHEIIIWILGTFSPSMFEGLLESSMSYIGAGTDAGGFTFWNDLDEYDRQFYEKPFEGVQVYQILGKDETIYISYSEYLYYLYLRIKKYVKIYPEEEKKLYNLAETLRTTYGIEENFTL